MRIGVIRNDLPGPVFLSDLEPVSRYNVPTDPRGQELYISRPTTGEIEAALASSSTGAGAVLNGGNISGAFPLTITLGVDDTLLLRTNAAVAFGSYVIAAAAYADLTSLVAAINAAIAGSGITARTNVAGNGVALESNTRGVTSYIENDTVVNGSTANTPLLLVDGSIRTMVSAATLITAALPVGGPLDVSTATLNAAGAGTAAGALGLIPSSRGTTDAVAQAIAPKLYESTTAIDSFLVGDISELLNANFNPDPSRNPPLVDGPAITVVEDDGVTLFGAALPVVASAVLGAPSPGYVTITGTDLASTGSPSAERDEVTVRFYSTGTDPQVGFRVRQSLILATAGGVVTSTSIVIPAALLPTSLTTTGGISGPTKVQTRIRSLASNSVSLT